MQQDGQVNRYHVFNEKFLRKCDIISDARRTYFLEIWRSTQKMIIKLIHILICLKLLHMWLSYKSNSPFQIPTSSLFFILSQLCIYFWITFRYYLNVENKHASMATKAILNTFSRNHAVICKFQYLSFKTNFYFIDMTSTSLPFFIHTIDVQNLPKLSPR